MRGHRRHGTAVKRQIVEEYRAGAALQTLCRAYDVCRNLVRTWIEKYEAGEFDAEKEVADTLHGYEAKIAALERLVGRQALEIELSQRGLSPRSGRRGEPVNATDGVDGSRSRHRDVPHRVSLQTH